MVEVSAEEAEAAAIEATTEAGDEDVVTTEAEVTADSAADVAGATVVPSTSKMRMPSLA